ncbi:GDSL esterase/lipase At5g45950 [Aristolochia californica]|uniref:GDSL esterase/lipase At5g45950 n=1 Tax=Aristolochia californica TaxID=171875 RepID=UPI0035DDFA41
MQSGYKRPNGSLRIAQHITASRCFEGVTGLLLLSLSSTGVSLEMESWKVALMSVVIVMLQNARASTLNEVRNLVVRNNITCVLVFGDSTVDPGNNNRLPTTFKSNFRPYGKNFLEGKPSGRFTNGRLPSDLIASELGITKVIPGFLGQNLTREGLINGASFASAASGYDDLTANLSTVLPFWKQIEYLAHYKIHLREFMGEEKASEIVSNAVFLISAGTNDFIQNYFVEATRATQYKVEEYVDFLITRMADYVKELHRHGGTRFVVVGIPPLGCLPLVRTVTGESNCAEQYNNVGVLFNTKLRAKLAELQKLLHVKAAYADIYGSLLNAIRRPQKYGFVETSKGCCGTGLFEYGETCRDQSTCEDPSKYAFWDAVHPTEKMYNIIANDALKAIGVQVFA